MIPAIEDIFHLLSRGEISFADAEKYVREHVRVASNTDDQEALRDHFAGLAMQGDFASGIDSARFHITAERAYQMADAMLVERDQ